MTTTQKHKNFIDAPIKDKPVTDLPGIGETYGKRLNDAGIDKAYIVLGKYLYLKKDIENFEAWLNDKTSANKKCCGDCSHALKVWSNSYI